MEAGNVAAIAIVAVLFVGNYKSVLGGDEGVEGALVDGNIDR